LDREKFLLDKFKCKGESPHFIKVSRWKALPCLMAEMGLKVGVEIGTEQGRFADCLLRKIPDLDLTVVDCWEPYEGYRENMGDHITEYEKRARERLEGRCKIIKAYSMDAVREFEDESLDFVYIDGNHNFINCANDISEWSKKVKVGGLIMGHDYTHNNVGYERTDVDYVVDAWTKAHDIKTWFVTSEGDRCPSYFWVQK
jgi:predicted O-methyltransferase YrrM